MARRGDQSRMEQTWNSGGEIIIKNDANHFYGGAFTPEGQLMANYFPMTNMTEAAGFGGVRRFDRGYRLS
jgi:hypothetical protein